jgi:LacI family transcriptional regulator
LSDASKTQSPPNSGRAAKSENGNRRHPSKPVTLRAVAERVRLTPSTVSHVLNNAPSARSVPQRTKDRIFAAARALNYQPNFFARSLKVKRSYTIGVIAEEIGDAYGSLVISGIERYLRQENFFFLTVSHRHDKKLLATYAHMLRQRGVEGFITVDTVLHEAPVLPTVAVAGHLRLKNVTNLVLDHERAALLALQHLRDLGHEEIAFMKGSTASSDTEDRWSAICKVANKLGIPMRPELVVQLEGDDPTPNLGYPFAQELLRRNRFFSALFAYNDNSAIGSIRACQEAGFRVPQDISVMGFDDIQSAAYTSPGLTTVRQPLIKMGELAAQTLLDRIEHRGNHVDEITVEPEFVVRGSTAPPRGAGNGPQ